MSHDLVIEGRFMDPVNGPFRGMMGIENGTISYLTEGRIPGKTKLTLSDSEIVFPGFIDTHVHFREPGWEHKGDMASESRAAAAGGVTTAMEMPNTLYQTTSRERVMEKKRLAGKAVIDVLFYGGIGPGNLYTLEEMSDLVPAYKLFMCESTGNLRLDSMEQIEEAFSCMSGLGKPVVVHCEDQAMINRASALYRDRFAEIGPLVHAYSRPADAEARAIGDALELSGKYGVPLSVCHVSTRKGMEAIKENGRARSEATIHHSLLNHDDLARLGAMGKMNPPLRERGDSGFILDSVIRGDVSFIGTDHAPHTVEEKQAGFMDAPSGVPAVEHYGSFVSLLLASGADPVQVSKQTSYNAARFFGLDDRGRIEEGFIADLAILDTKRPERSGPPYRTKCGWSPFQGIGFPGSVTYTIKSGNIIAERGKIRS